MHLSTQLKDYLAYAKDNGMKMILIVRSGDGTKLSKPLQQLKDAGIIEVLRQL